MKYYEIAYGDIKYRNKIVTMPELMKLYEKAKSENAELYRSVYTYDEKILEHLGTKKSVKGFIGKLRLERMLFDFDKGEHSDKKLQEIVRYFFSQLVDEWLLPKEAIGIWFSGRGYHLSAPNFFRFPVIDNLPRIVKSTVAKHFEEIDLSIYDSNSLIRVAYTINPRVRRYKVQITSSELFHNTPEEIISYSEENRKIETVNIDSEEIPDHHNKIVYPMPQVEEKVTSKHITTSKVTCMQKAYYAGPEKGNRHQTILRMVSAWRRSGVPLDITVLAMQNWASEMDRYEIEKIVKNTYEANNFEGYNYSCHDPIMHKYCDKKCVFYRNKNYLPSAENMQFTESNFVNFIRSDYGTKSIDLMKVLGVKNKKHLVIPGENVLLFGNGGLGKTALAQNIAINAAPLKVLYCNFEFPGNLFYRRLVQIADRMTKEEVIEYYKENTNSLSHKFDHIKLVNDFVDVKGLYQLEETYEPDLVILDTLYKVRTGDGNQIQKSIKLANVFKKLSKDYNNITIAINHISKSETHDAKGKRKKLTQHSGKGASDLEDMSDHVIMLEGDDHSDMREINAGKARDETKFSLPFIFEWKYFHFNHIGI